MRESLSESTPSQIREFLRPIGRTKHLGFFGAAEGKAVHRTLCLIGEYADKRTKVIKTLNQIFPRRGPATAATTLGA
jgi:hypothetical protein